MSNYYGCEGKHTEFTCLSKSYADKRFTRSKWCAPCLTRFPACPSCNGSGMAGRADDPQGCGSCNGTGER